MRWLRQAAMYILPGAWFYADRLTYSARRMLVRLAIGIGGVGVAFAAAGLVDATNWRDVFAGALLAWGVSICVWAVASHRRERDEVRSDLRRTAEVDLLHERLNDLVRAGGGRSLDIDHELEHAIGARMERLAHFAGLDEYRAEVHRTEEGYTWWQRQPEQDGKDEGNTTGD